MDRLEQIQKRLGPLKAALLNHAVYQKIDRLDSLRLFMEHHVFAVWDFMSLLKALQRRLCCVEVPWVPAVDALGSRLINEIVLAEESDEDGRGGYASHFELYHQAMRRCGASTVGIDALLEELRGGKPISAALEASGVPESARQFVGRTFAIIDGGNLCSIASAFTFGREDLLPAVFQRIVDELNVEASGGLEDFKYYLERHIGLDGEEHGPMAHRLLLSLCGSDESRWQVAEQAAVDSLEARQQFWDAIDAAIRQNTNGRSTLKVNGQVSIAGSLGGFAQGLQGAAPGNQLIQHLVHGFLMVRSRLEVGVILEVREERQGNLVADRRDLHLGHHQPQVLHGAHTAGAAIADKAGRLVVPLAKEEVDRILQGSADAVVVFRRHEHVAVE